MYIRETMGAIDSLEIADADRQKIYQGNAERLFNRTFLTQVDCNSQLPKSSEPIA